ncbi:MAG: DUF916 domain-containing protein [Actinomycetota bacterium]|nr:DUF916 domain-containing protein [Actinomycetota bacterium]
MGVACAAVLTMMLLSPGTPAWATSSPAAPAAPGLFPVHPGPHGYFEYTLSPGAATSGTIVVHDLTGSAARYLIYVTTATTSPTGGVAYGEPEAHLSSPASWVQLPVGSVQVPAQGAVIVHFAVAVPGATAPGDYVAALVGQTPTPTASAPASSTKRGVRLLTTTRVIVAVVVHVPGPTAPAARFGAPSVGLQQHRRQVLTIPIADTGNVLMKPYLAGDLRRCSGGAPVLRLARQLDTFVPRTSIDYPWYLNNQVLAAGCYRAALALDLGAGGTQLASYSGTFQVGVATTKVQLPPGQHQPIVHSGVPVWLVPAAGAAALLLLIATLLLVRSRKERRRLLARLADKDTPDKSPAEP